MQSSIFSLHLTFFIDEKQKVKAMRNPMTIENRSSKKTLQDTLLTHVAEVENVCI